MQMLYIVAAGGTIDGTIHPKVARMMPALARAALEHEHDAQSEGAQARARALHARGRYIPTLQHVLRVHGHHTLKQRRVRDHRATN